MNRNIRFLHNLFLHILLLLLLIVERERECYCNMQLRSRVYSFQLFFLKLLYSYFFEFYTKHLLWDACAVLLHISAVSRSHVLRIGAVIYVCMYVSTPIALTIHSHSDNVTIETLQTIHNDLNIIYSNYVCFISVIDVLNSYHFPSRLDRLGIIISRLQSAYFHSLYWLNSLSRFSKEVCRKYSAYLSGWCRFRNLTPEHRISLLRNFVVFISPSKQVVG
jgi:hypothetical protein